MGNNINKAFTDIDILDGIVTVAKRNRVNGATTIMESFKNEVLPIITGTPVHGSVVAKFGIMSLQFMIEIGYFKAMLIEDCGVLDDVAVLIGEDRMNELFKNTQLYSILLYAYNTSMGRIVV